MPANTSPVFTLVADAKTVSVTTATSDSPPRNGTGNNFATILTAGANGTRIDRITATSQGTSVAGELLLFIHDGSTNWFFKEIAISAITATTTVASFTSEIVRTDGLPLAVLPSGYSLKCAVTVTQTHAMNVTAFGGDY